MIDNTKECVEAHFYNKKYPYPGNRMLGLNDIL